MGMALDWFDPTKEEEFRGGGFDPIPNGEYLAIIHDSEQKEVKSNRNNLYLELKFQVVEGEYKGRFVWNRLNLKNQSPDAQRIARAELAAIMKVLNLPNATDSSELHDLPLVIDVRVANRGDGQGKTNEIRNYKSRAEWKLAQQTVPNNSHDKAPWE